MADDLLFLGADLSSSDPEPEDKNTMKKTQSVDTDSVSSDEDGIPLVKKKRSSAMRRGFNNNTMPLLRSVPDDEESNFYSTRVSKVMGSMNMGQLPAAMRVLAQSNSDAEDDEEFGLFTKKPAGKKALPKLKKTGSKSQSQGRSSKARAAKVATTPQKFAPYRERVIDLDSDSEMEFNSSPQKKPPNCARENSPLAPPMPPSPPRACSIVIGKKKPRQQKALKDACRELARAEVLQKDIDVDADVSIVDVFSPPSDRLQSKPIVVKVRSCSGIQRFTVKTGDNFTGLMQAMASHEYVPLDRIVMFLGDQTIEPYDTPGSLKLSVADILECHILRPGESANTSRLDESLEDDPDVIRVKVQGKDARSRTTVAIRKNEGLGKLMQKYAGSQKVALDTLRFEFDGDDITAQDTAEDIGLEDNFCIDVITH